MTNFLTNTDRQPADEQSGKDGQNQRTAIVTGATSGIGAAIAEYLAQSGMAIATSGFGDPKEIQNATQRIMDTYGVSCSYSDTDVCDPAAVQHMVQSTIPKFGRVDVLVNNAAYSLLR